MIRVIRSEELKTDPDLVCTSCGRDHRTTISGIVYYKEGVDFVFETDDDEEWCICMECKIKFDGME